MARGKKPARLPVGGGTREDRLRMRKKQGDYWSAQYRSWRDRLTRQKAPLAHGLASRRARWNAWRAQQQAAWQSRPRPIPRRASYVADFPLLRAQWDDPRDAATVKTSEPGNAHWKCPFEPHEFDSAVKDRAQKGTPCTKCDTLGWVSDVPALAEELAVDDPYKVGLSDREPRTWAHNTWAVNPETGSWIPVTHTWTATAKQRYSKGERCLVCAGSIVDATTSLATWHPDLAAELTDHTLDPSTLPCTDRETLYSWTCGYGHTWDASILNRVNGTDCKWCKTSTSRAQARLAAELRTLVTVVPPIDRDPRLPAEVPDLGSYQYPLPVEVKNAHERRRRYEEIDILLRFHGQDVAVEYDGAAYHGTVHRDRRPDEERKEAVLRDLGILLVRIREDALPGVHEPGVTSVSVTSNAPADETARKVLDACRDVFGLPVPDLTGYRGLQGGRDAEAYLAAIRNVRKPRKKAPPKPRRPRRPRTEIPVGTRFGTVTVTSPAIHQPGREGTENSWVYEVACDCGRTRTFPHPTLRHQPPKSCGWGCPYYAGPPPGRRATPG